MKRYTAVALILAALASSIAAQAQTTAYFLDNYSFSYRFNPALRSDGRWGFAGVMLGNISSEVSADPGLSAYLYPVNGKLVTGLNKAVDAASLSAGLSDSNSLGLISNDNILSAGFWTGEVFNNVEVNLRTDASLQVPGAMFLFLKSGADGNLYSIDDLSVNAQSYVEIAYGQSRRFGDLTLGARAKLLLGAAALDLTMDNTTVQLNSEVWSVHGDGRAYIWQDAANIEIDQDNKLSVDMDGAPSAAALGAALDFGVEYELLDGDLKVSAAILDFGFMNWKESITGNFNADANIDVTTADPLEAVGDIFDYNLQLADGRNIRFLSSTLTAGARYTIPAFDKLSAGAALVRRSGANSYYEAMLGATLTPAPVLSITGEIGRNTYGPAFGASASLRFTGINLFLGYDSNFGEVTPQWLPIDSFRRSLYFGLAIAFKQK